MIERFFPKGVEQLEDGLLIKDDSFLKTCDWRLKKLYDIWHSKTESYNLPGRKDFDPVEMRDLLPYLFMVEKDPEVDEYRYRLIGTKEAEFRGIDPTGLLVREAAAAENPQAAIDNYDYVVNTRQPLYNIAEFENGYRRLYNDQTLFLPTATNGYDVDIVIGISVQIEQQMAS